MLGTPQRLNLSTSPKNNVTGTAVSSTVVQKRNSSRAQSMPVASTYSKSDIVPVFVPRNDARSDQADESKRDFSSRRSVSYPSQPKPPDSRRFSNASEESDEPTTSDQPEPAGDRASESGVTSKSTLPTVRNLNKNVPVVERNLREDKCIGSMRTDNNSLIQPLSGYQDEACMSSSNMLFICIYFYFSA